MVAATIDYRPSTIDQRPSYPAVFSLTHFKRSEIALYPASSTHTSTVTARQDDAVTKGAFLFLTLAAAYLGFSALQIPQVNDKVLHFIAFFLLTIAFYFILDTTRRRVLNLTLLVVTFSLGLGSELIQGALPNGRNFDPIDIVANVVGSLAALGLCSVYHKRMLERKRRKKGYGVVPQEGEDDLELGGQEVGVVNTHDDDEAWDDMGEESGEGDEGRPALNSGGGREEENAKK